MYLNYFGSDWGNQRGYFSPHQKKVEQLATSSDKLITTTTQLVDEDRIKQMVWGLSPQGFVLNPGNLPTFLTVEKNQLSFSVGDLAEGKIALKQNLHMMPVASEREAVAAIQAKRVDATNVLFYTLNQTGLNLPPFVQLQLTPSFVDGRYQVWELVQDAVVYGRAILWLPQLSFSEQSFQVKHPDYLVSKTFSQ